VSIKTSFLFLLSLIIQQQVLFAQKDSIIQRIVLIGDAGELTDGKHPVVDAVKKTISLDKITTVLFLGDNIYRYGLPDDQSTNYIKSRAILDSQLSIVDHKDARVLMIPGNHDWDNGRRGGYDAIIREQVYVDFAKKTNVEFFPKDGCPGPVEIKLGKEVILLIFDSQWWLHQFEKPGIESDCLCKTEDELAGKIKDIISRHPEKLVILASHHPFKSNGIHGGFFTFKQHLFPLTDVKKNLYIPMPVVGSIYPITRSVFGIPQDLKHPNYANMIDQITTAVKTSSKNVIFVSGHEHNLELIQEDNYTYIISGGGCKENRVSKNTRSPFINAANGFSVLEVSANKNVTITFYTVTDSIRKIYNSTLLNFQSRDLIIDPTSPITSIPQSIYQDTITVAANPSIQIINGVKKILLGENYRHEWSTPVNMKVFHLLKEKGGLTIESLGLGKHTKSLNLVDQKGKEWVLRSVVKNSANALPAPFNSNLSEDILSDINTASHPYAAMAVPVLANPLKLTVAQPELFFVPDDTAFKLYRQLFANTVCLLEEKNPTPNGTVSRSTARIMNNMLVENERIIAQDEVLRARLLDILIGDYDRHLDQWKWYETDTGAGTTYHPVPRDRDQTFFYANGLIQKLITSRLYPFLKGFRKNITDIKWHGYSAKDFDRLFLNRLDASNWKNAIVDVQQTLTDSIVREAIQKMPAEIFLLDGERIIQKLINRRNHLSDKSLTYYKFISKRVNVLGSNQNEYFKISSNGNLLQVSVYALGRNNDTGFVIYKRNFDPTITREIRLYGLNGDDVFEIVDGATSKIKLRIIGGKGIDSFKIKGQVKNKLYDLKTELNHILDSNYTKNRFSLDPPVNDHTILGFNYATMKYPQLLFNYNSDDGLLAGGSFSLRNYGFRNLPYASDQKLSILYALNRKALQLNYTGEFNRITGKTDLLIKGNYYSPALKNFFGYGNETKLDRSKGITYYNSRYKNLEVEALFRRRYFEKIHLLMGPYFQHYSINHSANYKKVLSNPSFVGLDSARVYSTKNYLGAKLELNFDNTNNDLFPTRGLQWYNEFISAAGISKGSKNYSKFSSDMKLYASLKDPAKLVAIVSVGVGKVLSKNYEYFQAMSIGVNNNSTGLRKNRFTGTSSFYSNIELRLKLFTIQSIILPGNFGLTGIYNAGRVWFKGERSSAWHRAYGGGFYFIPYNLFIISANAAFSENERLINFSIGTKINITY
jgi:hypothetical protein